ncbi:putative leucine rich repeat protein [Chrysochromulina tobinii]|uniref:Putative leucine rich repeat protein n=1 Tax=Chrysochromulina tobinii TaxID=1460289 RepID=A0A0M0J7V3_9EUKA|nr:putative leucine rich repeat protein [Chrysochromulina tobinii]|eukprot:KOO22422.1 putative leucine rich repeat protein [Chrysochromulina sp. CCMP291]
MLLRVMESQTTADGSEKALVSRDGSTIKAIGWVLVFKEGMLARTLVPAPMLQLSFDLQVHTSQALTRALAIKQAGSQVRKRKDDSLPSQIAGKRPTFKPDDGAASRHTQVKKPATIILMFNCFNAAFDVTSWTGDVPFEKLSGETAFDLIAKKSRKRVGRVKLANELGMPFLARVEFPDEWVMAEEYGVYNDGWQGLASLERIVRLLRELGDDPSALLQDPKGLMRWYIDNQFADRKEERTMLMLAYEMRAVAILVDGVDEAAGMRDIVEAFVHFELVTGGNRLVVTSRPEGVDLDDYKSRFVVMNLLELSQEQQRNVIQMQLQGNDFFEHLVNIAECRKDLDERYNELFRSEALRTETEAFKFEEDEMMERDRRLAKLIDEEKAARAERATRETDEKAPATKEARAIEEEFARQARWTAIREAVVTNSKVPRDSLTIRRLTVDGQAELQSWLSKHYDFFFNRNAENLGHAEFDTKFELLLVFLVEAIGVPVLLSLLLLTYSTGASNKDVVDMNELPDGRLNLYKMGIAAGIRKRMLLNVVSEKSKQDGKDAKGAAEVVVDTKDEGAAPQRRERRKGALEQGGGGMSFSAAGPSPGGSENEKTKAPRGGAKDEPVLDLNSILRGKKVRVVTGEDDVAECYSLVVRVLDKTKQPGFDLRSGIVAVVPKSHTMHAPVTALVEYVTQPAPQSEAALMETCKKMLRRVAVDNQENGRREFTSKNVACALGGNPEELGLWSRLDLDHDYGVALCATLAKQSDKAPAQYQFKHLSFQEGLYAEHLLILVTGLAPPAGAGWHGWMSDKTASEFLNNRYMNNTCRIAAGTLGSLLARQRPCWNFRNATLTANGRSALWFITNENETVESINVSQNDVTFEDVPGICKMLTTCPTLKSFDLSDNDLFKMVEVPLAFSRLCDALGNNHILTDLNLNNNRLGMVGVRIVANALRSCGNLKRLGLSFNEPGVDPALANLLRVHTSLETIELVEKNERLFPSRAKDDIGRALIENKKKKLGFLHCDMFVLSETTKSLTWAKEASTSDAVLLAGVLATNTTLTTFNIAPGAILENKARSELGEALLNNPGSRVAFCNDFGLTSGVDVCEFDLSRSELKDVEPFRLLAGCLRGNRTLTHVTLKQLRMEQISTLALALRGNDTLAQLDMVNASRAGGQSVVRLPVPELNGSKTGNDPARVDLSKTCMEGAIGRVACAMIGTLISSNSLLERLDLSDTGVGIAIGAEGEGGHILLRPICESAICPINEINLTNVQLNDKAGGKLLTALVTGLGDAGSGYDKIKSLLLSRNELGKQFTTGLKTLLWSERAPCVLQRLDLSFNLAIDGYEMGLALKRNESLTSIDFRGVPGANTNDIYSFLGSFFLQEDCNCRTGALERPRAS